MAIMASAQCYKTESILVKCIAQADWGRKVIYVMDTDGKAYELVHERVDKNLESSWYFSKRAGSTSNVSQKLIGDGVIYFRGGQKLSKATSTPADTVVRDELNHMKQNVAAAYPKRLNASLDPHLWDLSNPTHPEFAIHQKYIEGTQLKWYVPCQRCGHDEALDFDLQVKEDGRVECLGCGKEFNQIWPGRWVAQNPSAKYPSYHIHTLMTALCDKVRRIEIFKHLNGDDPLEKEAAWQFDLGLPYADKTTGLAFDDIKAAAHDRSNRPFAPGGMMTVDPGGRFDVQIFAKPQGASVRQVVWVGTVSGWDELEKLEEESQVKYGIIDALPELDSARTWCRRRRGRWKRVVYTIKQETKIRWQISRDEVDLINGNRTALADWLVAQIRNKNIVYPAIHAKAKLSRLVKHLLAPKRRIDRNEKTGDIKVHWVEDAGKADHQFHCSIYGLIGWQHFYERANQGGSKRGSGSY